MPPSVDALKRGDASAWDTLYREHLRETYGVLFRLAGNDLAAADDLFQETWLEAWDAIDQYDPARGSQRSWLFGIARKRAALYWRRRLSQQGKIISEDVDVSTDGALLPDEVMEQLEQAAAVQAALLVLPEDRRRALTQKYVAGWSVEQIAAADGRSPKAVESLLTRARDELRSLLGSHFSPFVKGK